MILSCPSCSASFMISSEAIGPAGREVRCGKCGHKWFQSGEQDSLDELPPATAEESAAEPETVEEPADIEIDFTPAPAEPEPFPEVLKRRTPPPPPPKPKNKIISAIESIPQEKMKRIAAVMTALAIVSAAFYGLVAARHTLGNAAPFLGGAYDALGFDVKPPPPKIAFDRIKLTRESGKIVGSGYVINLTNKDLSVSGIDAVLRDKSGKNVQSVNIVPQSQTLAKESSQKIGFSFSAVPKDAADVHLTIRQ